MHYFVFQEPGTSDVFDSSIRDTEKSGAMVLGKEEFEENGSSGESVGSKLAF